MPLSSVKDLLDQAMEGSYAVGAFDATNMDMVLGIVDGAVEENAPVIIQFHPDHINYGGLETLFAVVRETAADAPIPIGVSLDHGENLYQAAAAIRVGYTGIMIDGSELPLDENIEVVREVVRVCKGLDIAVEAGLGEISRGTEHVKVSDAVRLVKESGAQLLAPSVGNVHGCEPGGWKPPVELDFDLISEMADKTGVPLSLHGGSGIGDEDLKKAVGCGVRKVVIYTDCVREIDRVMRELFSTGKPVNDLLMMCPPIRDAVKSVVRHKIQVFGSNGRAPEYKPTAQMRIGRGRM